MRHILMMTSLLIAVTTSAFADSAPQVQTEMPTLQDPAPMVEAVVVPKREPDHIVNTTAPKRHAAADSRFYYGACGVYISMLKYTVTPISVENQIYFYKQLAAEGCDPRLLTGDETNRYMRCMTMRLVMRDIIHQNRQAGSNHVDIDPDTYDQYRLASARREALQCS
ncbi:MAG: hypothetical protein VX730_06970 [Pseudomonadota bacterium]|nr:hypothetical protein [Pseudomonadota bacterium]